LHKWSPCSWLDVVIPHPSTYSCSRLGYSGCSSPDIIGGGDHLLTTSNEEAACSGPKCSQNAVNCNIGSAHFWSCRPLLRQ
jgi:hypothetical protein